MSWAESYPINFAVDGDTTSQAVQKFINEISVLYSLLNRLRSCDKGVTAPSDPETNALWVDTSSASAIIRSYNGSTWVNILDVGSISGLQAVIDGINASIATKLDITSYTASDILTKIKTVDGTGSGLDADLLDGQHGGYYLPATSYTASDILTKIKTVDGTGSGLDADTLDGQHGSYYYPASNPNGYTNDQTASEILTLLKTVDGAGSLLDADTLDGVQLASIALLASPALTGNPTAPTQTAGNNSTRLATTAFVLANSINTGDSNVVGNTEIKKSYQSGGTWNVGTSTTFVLPVGVYLIYTASNDGVFYISATQYANFVLIRGMIVADGVNQRVVIVSGSCTIYYNKLA